MEKSEISSRRRNSTRVVLKNRNVLPLRSSSVPTTIFTPIQTTSNPNPKTTQSVVRRKLISRTPPVSRRTQEISSTTTEVSTNFPDESLDDEVASILPALSSVNTRKP